MSTVKEDAQSRKTKLEQLAADALTGEYLHQIPLLAKLSELERNKLASVLTVKQYKDGDNIVTQGQEGTDFFIIKTGRAAVILEDNELKTQNEIAELREKDYFGEQALLNKSKRAATVRAKGDVACLLLNESSFLSVFSKDKLNVQFVKRNAVAEAPDLPAAADNKPKIAEKTTEELEFLKGVLNTHVLFQSIEPDVKESIIKKMWKQEITKDTAVIKQGEKGEHFYVIEKGEFEVFKKEQDDSADEKTKNVLVNYLSSGHAFGELALMYNSPRAASVVAASNSTVWVLDRRTFRVALRKGNKEKLAEYVTFLESVPLFHSLLSSEREKISEALEEKNYNDQEVIMKQGELGDAFFIVTKGEVVVSKDDKVVETCKRGDYFGERALLKNEPRAATVTAKGPTSCVVIFREEFIQLLGPVQDVLRERVASIDSTNQDSSDEGGAQKVLPKFESPLLPIKKVDLIVQGILGKGSFGIVMLVKDKNSGESYALKRLSKAQMVSVGQHLHVVNERNVMVELSHPFITKL
jgi:CRP-like cAMP-binding protein